MESDVQIESMFPYKAFFLGDVLDERAMNVVYNASDVLVVTSKAENYPLTVLESSVCCTPVLAFDVGGIRDIIDYYKIGVIVENKDMDEMVSALWKCLYQEKKGDAFLINKLKKMQQRDIIERHMELINA